MAREQSLHLQGATAQQLLPGYGPPKSREILMFVCLQKKMENNSVRSQSLIVLVCSDRRESIRTNEHNQAL